MRGERLDYFTKATPLSSRPTTPVRLGPVEAGVSPALFLQPSRLPLQVDYDLALRRAALMLRYLRFLTISLTLFPLATRACDLCGCYSPQVESMPKEKVSLTGFYTAIAE